MSQKHNLLVHIDALYRSALYLVKNESNADDLVQETYLRAFKFLKDDEEIDNVKAWLFIIMTKRLLVPLAGIAVATIMVVYFFVVPGNLKKDDALYLAESKYHNYLMQQLDLDIRSQDPDTIVKYLREQTNSSVVLPEIKDDVQLIGASLSEIEGVKVSQVYYMHDETPVSLMIVCDSDSIPGYRKNIDFSGMKEMLINERIVYYDEKGYCGHCKIMGWKEAGSQYVMVSRLNSDEMMRILKKV